MSRSATVLSLQPGCMEVVYPNVPSQEAGIDFAPWNECFDNCEYLTELVSGFCNPLGKNKLVTMVYHARVMRAGIAIAAPAQAQLLYEAQFCALTLNTTVTSEAK